MNLLVYTVVKGYIKEKNIKRKETKKWTKENTLNMGEEFYPAFAADRKEKKLAQLTAEEKALVESFCSDPKSTDAVCSSTTRLFEQIMFKAPILRMSENQTMGGGKSYSYYFTPESSVPKMLCAHTIELSTVFNHPES